MSVPQFVWDPVKAALNKSKHGIDFEEALTVFLDPLLLLIQDLAHSDLEDRWIALGKSAGQLLLVVVHTENDLTIRIISARKATPRETRQYERQAQIG
jgi:uncharacterized DUF497 family protein